MTYYLGRGGQKLGPYTMADLQNMQAQGQIQSSDLAWAEGMASWVPVAQVLGGSTPAPLSPGGIFQPSASQALSSAYPAPPSMQWWLVLILGFVTCGIFMIVWLFIQAAFVKKLDPKSKGMLMYILYIALYFGGLILSVIGAAALHDQTNSSLLSTLGSIPAVVCLIIGHFNMKASIEQHYNRVEPVGLRLSGVMVFFFNVLYFQYHFARIAEMKRTGVITPQ